VYISFEINEAPLHIVIRGLAGLCLLLVPYIRINHRPRRGWNEESPRGAVVYLDLISVGCSARHTCHAEVVVPNAMMAGHPMEKCLLTDVIPSRFRKR